LGLPLNKIKVREYHVAQLRFYQFGVKIKRKNFFRTVYLSSCSNTVLPAYNDIGLSDTSSISSFYGTS